jgi:hypothetical protein
MTEKSPTEKFPLTIHLSPDVAKRLMAAAETQKRPVAEVAADLLDRHLPRLPGSGSPKGKIPYT